MSKPDYDFRPNPARAVRIFNELTEEVVSNVVGQIIDLRKISDPITVYINSPGGIVRGLEIIRGALKCKDTDGKSCRIITVAVGDAASAAANLLGTGDYAIAYPYSIIHFHGIRRTEVEVTKEDAQWLADYLASRNRQTALTLAEMVLPRMVHRYTRLADGFDALRKESKEEVTDLECFIAAVHSRVSGPAGRVLQNTWSTLKAALALSSEALEHVSFDDKKAIEQDREVFNAVLAHDIKLAESDPTWRLNEAELQGVVADYLLLRDFHIGEHLALLAPIIDVFGPDFLSPEELHQFDELVKESDEKAGEYLVETVRPRVLEFWNYAVLMCRRLQEGENRLTAEDAYWLGILDEVTGTDMYGDRAIMESELNEKKQEEENPISPTD